VRCLRRLGELRWLLDPTGAGRGLGGRLSLSLLLGAATVASGVTLLATASYVISAAALGTSLLLLTLPIYVVRISGLARAASHYGERLVSHDATFRMLARVRVRFYERLEPLAPARLLEHRSGDLLSRITADVDELQNLYLRGLHPLLVAALTTLLAGGFLYLFSPALALAAVALLVASGLGVPLLVRALSRGLGRREISLQADLRNGLVDGVQGLTDLLASGREPDQRRLIGDLDARLGAVQRRGALVSGLQRALGEAMPGLAALLVLIIAIPVVASGEIRGVYLAVLVLVAVGAFEAIGPLGEAFRAAGKSLAAADRLSEVASAKPRVSDPEEPLVVGAEPRVEFERVGFRYAEAELPALDDVSFTVQPGSRIAVVGPSGSGKTTLAHLLLRFWDPEEGAVRLGGNDVRRYRQEDLREAVGLVSQGTHIFNDTLRDNLLLARPEATEEELEHAVEVARLSEVVERLPEGLDTLLGEQGERLSGGERQRLSVARTLLRDPPVLVLDEATADLDAATERDLREAFATAARGRTTIQITHRLVGLEEMDEILVMDSGRIVERGTHAELIRRHGLYHRMVNIQRQMLTEPATNHMSHTNRGG
jgi:thiol reductant ABC exporter CydC subunit